MSIEQEQLHQLAEPLSFGERVKTAIDRAARRSGLSYWRAFDIWYGKARRIEQWERDQISEALDKKLKEATRNEMHELRRRMAALEARLVLSDEEFHRENLEVVRAQGGGFGGIRRPVAAPA